MSRLSRSHLAALRFACAVGIAIAFASCDGFVGDVSVKTPQGSPVAITDSEYIVLRPVALEPLANGRSAVLYGRTLYFRTEERILDLRHLDVGTAAVIERPWDTGTAYVISIGTTDQGASLLGDWTSRNVERQLGVFVEGRLVSAPVVESTITDMIILDAGFTKQEAESVVKRLRNGGSLE